MEIDWPPFPPDAGILDHAATVEDLAAGRAGFMLHDSVPLPMGMSRLGFVAGDDGPVLGAAVQAEVEGERCLVGVRHGDGTFSVCTPAEFKEVSRCLALFHKPGYTLNELEQDWKQGEGEELPGSYAMQDVLAVRRGDGPVLFVRYAAGDIAAQEIALIKHPKVNALKECTAVFEVSFLDVDEVLDEINTLIEVQERLQTATDGYLYLDWNGTLFMPGE